MNLYLVHYDLTACDLHSSTQLRALQTTEIALTCLEMNTRPRESARGNTAGEVNQIWMNACFIDKRTAAGYTL